jgi:hypothetical protein
MLSRTCINDLIVVWSWGAIILKDFNQNLLNIFIHFFIINAVSFNGHTVLDCFDIYVEGVSIHLQFFAHKKDINEMCIKFLVRLRVSICM